MFIEADSHMFCNAEIVNDTGGYKNHGYSILDRVCSKVWSRLIIIL